MTARAVEALTVFGLATILTGVIAAPVLRAPSERVFGMESVGRHHDPFTVMQHLARPVSLGVHSQPVTDITGALVARVSGRVPAYNWLVLLTFPLAAVTAYLLARHLSLSRGAATVAAFAFAFSPFHLAHAAYHPHIAQIQWIPLYLLALWRCLDHTSAGRLCGLAAATLAVTLSNFYGGLIAALITPVAVGAYWFMVCRTAPRAWRRLVVTVGSLLALAAAGLTYVWLVAGAVWADRVAFAFPRADLFRYSAHGWSYLMPPVAHPLFGDAARRAWNAAGVHEGILEQQLNLGVGFLVLALIALIPWARSARLASASVLAPGLLIVAAVALGLSLWPSALYDIAPMFRAYARFGVVVQLMTVLLAGIGIDRLWRTGGRPARAASLALVALAAAEYAVLPSTQWRDALPTSAHRWVMQQGGYVKVLDCTPLSLETESVQWLSNGRVTLLNGPLDDCAEPNVHERLAAEAYTHVLVRRGSADERAFDGDPRASGFLLAAQFSDGQVFTVSAPIPAVYTAAMTGFFPRERDAGVSWRWMGADASWRIVNTGTTPVVATLAVELSAFHQARRMEVLLDGEHNQTVLVDQHRRTYHVSGLRIMPGDHALVFRAAEVPTAPGDVGRNGDRRPLSVALGTWTWIVRGAQP